jgi:DNA invertase Pin-like site-specific DNA recombinase
MFHIAGAFAELEREIIRERVKAGLVNAKRRGRKVGRPRVLVNVQDVFEKAFHGLSERVIAKGAGVSEATVRRILRAPHPVQNHRSLAAVAEYRATAR